MKLQFEMRRSYGRERYYPTNDLTRALVTLAGDRKCLRSDEVEMLKQAGFIIETETV